MLKRYPRKNPFEAYVSSGTDAMNIAKLRMEWNHDFGVGMRATFWAAAAQNFDETTDLIAAVPMAGVVAPSSLGAHTWAEYGGRLNFVLSPQIAGDVTLAGVSGFEGMETALQVRAGASLAF